MTPMVLFTLGVRCLVFAVTLLVGIRLWQFRRSDGPVVEAFALFFLANALAMGWYVLANLETALWGTTHMLRYGLPVWGILAWALWRLWRALHPQPPPRTEYEG